MARVSIIRRRHAELVASARKRRNRDRKRIEFLLRFIDLLLAVLQGEAIDQRTLASMVRRYSALKKKIRGG